MVQRKENCVLIRRLCIEKKVKVYRIEKSE